MNSKIYELALKLSAKLDSSFMTNTSKAEKRLQEIERRKKLLDKVMSERRATLNAAQAYAQAQQRLQQLQRQLKQTKNPSQQLKAEIIAAASAVKRANAAYLKQKEVLDKLQHSAGTAGKSYKQLRLEIEKTQKAQKIAALQNSIGNIGIKAKKRESASADRYLSSLGVIASVGGMAYSAAQPLTIAADFEATMSRVAAVSGATETELAALTKQARELGATTVWSASDAAEGMTYLSMAGFNTEQMLQAMPGMLDLASAGGIDLANAADIASNVLSGFGLKASEINRVGDVLTNTFTKSNTSMATLGETMKYVAPIAASVGVDLETVSAMAGKLGDAGIQGSEAGTALRAVISRLAAPSKAGYEALNALGVSTTDANGKLRAMPEVLADLSKRMSKLPDNVKTAMTKTIFETEAMSAAFVLMEQAGNGSLSKMVDTVSRSGTAAEIAAKQNDNLIGDYKNLQSAAEEVAHILYEELGPSLRSATQKLTGWITTAGTWIAQHKTFVGWVIKVVAVVGAFIGTLSAVNMLFSALSFSVWHLIACSAKLISTIISIGRAFMIVGAFLSANPFVLVIAGIMALIAAGYLLYKNWDTIKAKAIELWFTFKNKFPQAAAIVESVFALIGTKIDAGKRVIGGLIDFVTGVFTGDWEKAWHGLIDIVKGLFDLLPGFITKPIKTIADKVGNAWDTVKGWVGFGESKVTIASNNVGSVPQLASGGITTGATLAMIGEGKEQEAVLPLSKLANLIDGYLTPRTGMSIAGLSSMLPSSSNNNSNSSPVSITFSPVINISSDGAKDPYTAVKEALSVGSSSFKREIEKYFAERERLSYE